MDAKRLTRVLSAVGNLGKLGSASYMEQVCAAGLKLMGMNGSGLSLMANEADVGAVWASDARAQKVEDLQFTLGEGPALDAYRLGIPALEPALAGPQVRWPFFGPAAVDLGISAVFSFPLQIGFIRLGALNLFRDKPGFLSRDELADALVLADVATQDIVDLQSAGRLGSSGGDYSEHRTKVHQATGMVAAQIHTDMATALARIRGHAFSHGTSVFAVAEQIVSLGLRLEDAS